MERYYAVICIMQFHGGNGRCTEERDSSAAAPGLRRFVMWGRLASTSMRGTEQEVVEMVLSSSMLDRGCSCTPGTKSSEGVQWMWLIMCGQDHIHHSRLAVFPHQDGNSIS